MVMRPFLILLFTTVIGFQSELIAQEKEVWKVDNTTFAIDESNKRILWNSTGKNYRFGIECDGKRYLFIKQHDTLQPSKTYVLVREKDTFQLYLTSLSLVQLSNPYPIKDEPKTSGVFAYGNSQYSINAIMGIELRGNSAMKYPKKSYDLEIRKDSVSKKSEDVRIPGLRKDDDWILNSMYNEPLKIRSHFANSLWLEMRKREEDTLGGKGRPGIGTQYVEVFRNNRYEGVYLISEQVDRKLLNLSKFDDSSIKGLLYKANSYDVGTSFEAVRPFNNAFPHWAGFEMEYPYENYEAHWEPLHTLVEFTVTSTDAEFKSEINRNWDLENVIDYHILVNLLRATDNLGKNYFLARQDQGTPFYFVPWDLDGVLGIIQDGKRIPTTNDILSNGLFDRLMELDPDSFKARLQQRWNFLRETTLDIGRLEQQIRSVHDNFEQGKILERDHELWSDAPFEGDDLPYMLNWLKERVAFLDQFYNGL